MWNSQENCTASRCALCYPVRIRPSPPLRVSSSRSVCRDKCMFSCARRTSTRRPQLTDTDRLARSGWLTTVAPDRFSGASFGAPSAVHSGTALRCDYDLALCLSICLTVMFRATLMMTVLRFFIRPFFSPLRGTHLAAQD